MNVGVLYIRHLFLQASKELYEMHQKLKEAQKVSNQIDTDYAKCKGRCHI